MRYLSIIIIITNTHQPFTSFSTKGNKLEADKQRVMNFLKDYSANRGSSLKSVKKAESEYTKATKKKGIFLTLIVECKSIMHVV